MRAPARPVPNHFHFVYGLRAAPEPFHLVHYLCIASCLQVNQPEAIYFYYHNEPYGKYWDLIKDHIIPIWIPRVEPIAGYRYKQRSVRKYIYAHQTDFVRLEKLLYTGGVYADIDTIFVNPLPAHLFQQPFVIGRGDDVRDETADRLRPSLCNAFLMAERNASFARAWLEQMPASFDGTWIRRSALLPQELAQAHPDWVHIEPQRSFYKYRGTRQGLHTLLEGCDADHEGVLSIHLWAHLWWSRRRRDFSSFHEGRLTEDYIRRVETTYNRVARGFLPPAETRRQWWVRQTRRAQGPFGRACDAAGKAKLVAYNVVKLAAFSLLNDRVFPHAGEHLDYARRQLNHPYVGTRFRPRTRFEQTGIFESLAFFDEYEICAETFAPTDVILDIGAHVGLFSYMCHRLGSRALYAYEPERDNFRLLARSLRGLTGVHPYNLAVFRSDGTANARLAHSGYGGENTGTGNVILGGRLLGFERQELSPSMGTQLVNSIPFDEILARFVRVSLVKLDCEGSEFPILLTSRQLDRIERIIAEYHEIEEEVYPQLDPQAQVNGYTAFRVQSLVVHLQRFGFHVTQRPYRPHCGLIFARRVNPLPPSSVDPSRG